MCSKCDEFSRFFAQFNLVIAPFQVLEKIAAPGREGSLQRWEWATALVIQLYGTNLLGTWKGTRSGARAKGFMLALIEIFCW